MSVSDRFWWWVARKLRASTGDELPALDMVLKHTPPTPNEMIRVISIAVAKL